MPKLRSNHEDCGDQVIPKLLRKYYLFKYVRASSPNAHKLKMPRNCIENSTKPAQVVSKYDKYKFKNWSLPSKLQVTIQFTVLLILIDEAVHDHQ
jgi:hypothetical protein